MKYSIFLLLIIILFSSCCPDDEYRFVDHNILPNIQVQDTLIYLSEYSTDTFYLDRIEQEFFEGSQDEGSLICSKTNWSENITYYFNQYPNDTTLSILGYWEINQLDLRWLGTSFNKKSFIESMDISDSIYHNIIHFHETFEGGCLQDVWYAESFGVIQYKDENDEVFIINKIISHD